LFARCETKRFIPAPHFAANASGKELAESSILELGSTCLFLQSRAKPNKLRLKLCRAGLHLGRRVVAAAEIHASPITGLVDDDVELPLISKGARNVEVVGHVSIGIQLMQMSRGELASSLTLAHAKPREHGYLLPGAMYQALDKLCDSSDSEKRQDDDSSKCGIVLQAHPAGTVLSRSDRWDRISQMAAICSVTSLM